ncbi:MAG: hypothetical protein JJT77_01555 [Crocinitomicaceae bacterium]|nr:hypothetical protein [Crocinitomicaceae bacterium]
MRYILFGLGVILLILLIWNVYLIQSVENTAAELQHLQLKLDMCNGDVHVIMDDLIMARDSIRILTK